MVMHKGLASTHKCLVSPGPLGKALSMQDIAVKTRTLHQLQAVGWGMLCLAASGPQGLSVSLGRSD
jgi:hypothetical protein